MLVLGLLLSRVHQVDWAGAWKALKSYPPVLLLEVLLIATVSHALYGSFDLIGRWHVAHRLPAVRTWAIAVTSYAFNLNLGALIGGVALRVRLYSRAGLDEAQTAQVIGLSLATNWLGYGLVAGGLFAARAVKLPRSMPIGASMLQALGFLMIGLVVAYVVGCRLARGREWRLRGRRLHLPPARIALLQLLLSTANWCLMGAAMYLLLGQKLPYSTALGVLMAASIVGVVTPIPAGLGVLEAVYLALLSRSLGQGTVLGAVLAFRALYYLLPLAGALPMYLALERLATTHPARPSDNDPRSGQPARAATGVPATQA